MNETRRDVIEHIEAGPVTGPELADRLDISRAAVWKHVEALRDAGFEIAGTADGYTLETVSGYSGPLVEYGLDAPFSVEFHDNLPSTNARARELAGGGTTDVVVVAERQTGGTGRLGREWESPAGGIWASVVTRPDVPPARAPLFTLAAAVATAEVVREAGVDARIKWPNDVIVPADTERGYRKLAGILTEMEGEADRIAWLVTGIGVNASVDPKSLPDGATSISAEAEPVDRRVFCQQLLERFDTARSDLSGTVERWRSLADTIGQRVRVQQTDRTIEGTAVDVTATGALIVETTSDRVTVTAGDCEHLRPDVTGGE
ncbi:biotin--[acetyl-CoA-carboxylase] ligase [Halovivax cerinus]|uniref:Biotin--[acetyl-CoA-carboxylase] ligase n=1 Tax=Halovivax cerinus TaxID=1487865 RepID=A0ABD5NTF2_9EURY|nr:biotin--[acetyl-CoA-carboxylase] ligase [Halovivax cerinus]